MFQKKTNITFSAKINTIPNGNVNYKKYDKSSKLEKFLMHTLL